MAETVLYRNSFVFYQSFYKQFKKLNTAEQSEFVTAICQYAFEKIEPQNLSEKVDLIWEGVLPQINANHLKYENGCKGGRPPNNRGRRIKLAVSTEKNSKITLDKPNENVKVLSSSNFSYNNNLDILTEEEREKLPLTYKKWLHAFPPAEYPYKTIFNKDGSIVEIPDYVEIDKLIKHVKAVPFLKFAQNFNLKTCVAHYQKIITGGYAAFTKEDADKADAAERERIRQKRREFAEQAEKEKMQKVAAEIDILTTEQRAAVIEEAKRAAEFARL